ncbi:hypothetical protein L1887_23256 [Cichorium endivia]|nr:hypothetical protein L1887_23256 [Cichorium endivia]
MESTGILLPESQTSESDGLPEIVVTATLASLSGSLSVGTSLSPPPPPSTAAYFRFNVEFQCTVRLERGRGAERSRKKRVALSSFGKPNAGPRLAGVPCFSISILQGDRIEFGAGLIRTGVGNTTVSAFNRRTMALAGH